MPSVSRPEELTREAIADFEKKHPALKALNDATLDKPRGFILKMDEVTNLTGPDDKTSKKAIKLWKAAILALRGITVIYDAKNRGYRFVTVGEMLFERQDKVMKSMEKKHRQESVRLALMRDPDFSNDHERRMRILLQRQHDDNRGRINSQREQARIATKQPETLPRIVPPGNDETKNS